MVGRGLTFCGVSYLVLRSLLRVVQAANGDSGAGDDSHGLERRGVRLQRDVKKPWGTYEFFGVRAA